MKIIKTALSLLTLISLSTAVAANSVKKVKVAKKPINVKSDVGTDFKFDGMTVHGQYQSANEGLVTVENEKELTNLLDYRSDYKDRLKKSRMNP
jgi:hypothetical protein